MFSSRRSELSVEPLSLEQVQALPALPSGYETDRVFNLVRERAGSELTWQLREVRLDQPLTKMYDQGEAAEWLDSYADAGPPDALRFLGATHRGQVLGIATWTVSEWNAVLWLVDIRVRPADRGSGVGSALLDALTAQSRSDRLRGISVETQIRNYPAVCFYRKHGFQIAGFNDHLYTNSDLADQDVALFLFKETD
jgi:ribosomal protein S18 acetylase RimI-like enzyme